MRILLALLALHQIQNSGGIDAIQSPTDETILCRSCGRGLADPSFLHTSHLSPEYLARRNHTKLFGSSGVVSVEKLRNPAGVQFEIVTFDTAGCSGVGNWEKEGTWFPGYLWRVCVCPKCGAHVGWMFEPEDLLSSTRVQPKPSQAGFYGIILKKVISEDFAHTVTLSGNHLH
eukprot:TRINITY_DN12157_c0_g1_i2.p1 TRINITY_DN12157_c0_g1~~TRINITY_DN12157_c0_g1_i2.p1  ORF type:complete len:173 (-),score=26.89 TRINITY_DN12157_c0_g1_i2:227-745(-)